MPEALAAIPPKSVQTGNSSETDASSAAAPSSDDASSSSTASKPPATVANTKQQRNGNGQNQKTRKSKGRRSSQKKPLKINQQQKTAAALNLKSQIPRPFPATQQQLTPSSSTTSLSTLSTTTKSTQSGTPRPPGLLRQHSSIRLNFRLRKSTSQMDFKHSRRNGNIGLPLSGSGRGELRLTQDVIENQKMLGMKIGNMCDIVTNNITKSEKSLIPKNMTNFSSSPSTNTTTTATKSGLRSGGLVVTHSQSSMVQKMFQQEDYYYVLQERDPKVAGMRIFATIMLNAWRKRRDEVKRLTGEVSDLKRGSIKAKNQLHVFNTLFRVEQKRNDELSCQLKRSLEDINQTKSSCESLTTSLISLKADKALLEQQLQIKEKEFEGINAILTQTKSDLFKAMALQRDLQANLSMEQRKVQTLENQKNELINEICELNNEFRQKQEAIQAELLERTAELEKANKAIEELEQKLAVMEDNEQKLIDYALAETQYKADIEQLQSEVDYLKKCLEATLSYRIKSCWNQTIIYQKTTLKVVHWIAYYMLPATPPPKPKLTTLPFGLTLQKALSIVKR